MITLAFYKGWDKAPLALLQDFAIRAATRGKYSHVEMIMGPAELDQTHKCYSSSARDGGVRSKDIFLNGDHWDLVEIDQDPEHALELFEACMGMKYDYLGIVLSQIISIGRHAQKRWFCSEICMAALNFRSSQKISPQLLFDIVTWPQPDS